MDMHFAVEALATAFTIIDPFGMAPLALSMTSTMPAAIRPKIIDRAVLVAACIIVFMAAVGRQLLGYLGITLPAFSIAGGILLLLVSIDMLFARPPAAKKSPDDDRDIREHENVAVFPLAIPMISGPGTIATVLLLVSLANGDPQKLAIVYGAYGLALLVTWGCMRGADKLLRFAGRTGIQVVTRVLGIILSALAVQFMINGLLQSPLFHAVKPA
jgi:multiple antibiotic resistance protein